MNLWLAHGKVVLLCVGGAVGYGIIHDQVTARLCVEYFTVAHPPLPWLHTTSPTLIGLAWGLAATFWVGMALGFPLALASQLPRSQTPVPLEQLAKSIAILLVVMALAALLSGIVGFELARRGMIAIPDCWSDDVPVAHHHRFMAVWFAHGASYLVGLVGGVFLIFRTWNQRGRPVIMEVFPRNGLAVLRMIAVVAAAGMILWFRFFRH